MGPKPFNAVPLDGEFGSVARLPASPGVPWARVAGRLVCGAAGCLLLSGCTLFGQSSKSQSNLSPSYGAAAKQNALAKKADEGGSWLPSWLRPKDPPPPASIGEWMDLPQSKLPPSK